MKERFARSHLLFWQYVKRDWKKIFLWVFGLGLFSGGFVPAFQEIAKDEGALGLYETLKNPAMISMIGPTPVEQAANYSIGAMYAHQMLLFSGLFAAIISILHILRHTRKAEEEGILEFIRAFQIGRQANALALMMEIIFIHLLLTLFITGLMISFQVDSVTWQGALLFGSAVGMAGLIGATLALITAQLMAHHASCVGLALGMIGFLYLSRGMTDLSQLTLSAFNPLGWVYFTFPFTENNWYFLLIGGLFVVFGTFFAFFLKERRDLGSGYFPERSGRAYAKSSLLSVWGLLFRLNRGILLSWLLAFIVLGTAYGSIYGDMQTFVEGNEMMQQMFSQAGFSLEESFTATIIVVMVCLVAILPIVIINKLFADETRSHFSQVFATKVSRTKLFITNVFLAVLASIVGILCATGSLGLTAIYTTKQEGMNLGDFMIAGFHLFPVVLFFLSLATLALGWLPSLGKFVYIYLTYAFFLDYFSKMLNLPEALLKTSLLYWPPKLPIEAFDGLLFFSMTAISLILICLGWLGYNRRDLQES